MGSLLSVNSRAHLKASKQTKPGALWLESSHCCQLDRKIFLISGCFFPAMHLSLSILQLCFHISGILLLISLMKHNETAFSYLSIFTITAEVLRGNGPSCLDAVKQWLCSLLQDAAMPDSHHPCADMCMYHCLHASWQVKCSKEVTQERHWQGTVLRAAGAMWRTAATQPPQLGSASQRSYAKEQRWSMLPVTTGEVHWLWLPAPLCLAEIRWEKDVHSRVNCSVRNHLWRTVLCPATALPGLGW